MADIRQLGTFHLALAECQGDAQRLAAAFVSCPRVTRILDVLCDRCGFDHVSLDPTLQTDVWVRLWPLLPWKDEPQRIYSFIWRIAEYTAMGTIRKQHAISNREVPMASTAEDDSEAPQHHEQITDGGILRAQQDIDTAALRKKFLEKVKRVGWPDGVSPARRDIMQQPGPKMRDTSSLG